MIFRRVFVTFILIFFFCTGITFGDPAITRGSPNYLIILVHGINTPGWVFRGHGENGSDVSGIPEKYQGMGDILGYLTKPADRGGLGLDGYVYYYTFSQRDGRKGWEKRGI